MTDRPGGPLTPQQERELMGRLAAGEEDAVRILYERFARTIFSMGIRMLRSAESAEDLTQEVFVAAWRRADRYDPARGRLSTWLMAIAHNTAVDRLRREAVRPRATVPLDLVPERGSSEEEGIVDRLAARTVLDGLSAAERRLLELAYFRGWTAREIAEADGTPLGTVKTRIRTTLIKLRASHKREEA